MDGPIGVPAPPSPEADQEPIGFPSPRSCPSLETLPGARSAGASSTSPVGGGTASPPGLWKPTSSGGARWNPRTPGKRHAAKLARARAVQPPSSELEQLQLRVDRALSPSPASGAEISSPRELQLLAADLARAGETAALVRVWDLSGGSQAASESTWEALEELHSRGKRHIPRGTLQLPALNRRCLSPARRLHKIAKGRIYKNRSKSANEHLEDALVWLEEQRAKGRRITGRARMKLARELTVALDVPLETGRGLVTKMKQKRLLDKVEDGVDGEHSEDAVVKLKEQRAKGRKISGLARKKPARELTTALNVPVASGHGVVTKLKQRRFLDKVEDTC